MWLWWVAAASAQDLIVDGDRVLLHGSLVFDTVQVINGGVVQITPYNGESGTGTLILNASRILLDETSRIEGNGAGWQGRIDAAGEGSGGGPAPGSGGSHGGVGAPGRDEDCSRIGELASAAPDDLGPGAAGGGTPGAPGGAGGASVQLIADDVAIYGTIDASGEDSGAGGGAGGTVLLEADRLVCAGQLLARGGEGGGGGGGGVVEQRWDSSGLSCAAEVSGGASRCGAAGGAGLSTAEAHDWDGDGLTTEQGDCAPREPAIPAASDPCDGIDQDCDGQIDEDAETCGGCQVAVLSTGTYLLCADSMSWFNAQDSCRAEGAFELAAPSSASENEALHAAAASVSAGRWWLGGSDTEQEGLFAWTTAEPFTWSSFEVGEPNNLGSEDCLLYREGLPLWDDNHCTNESHAYLCEACPGLEWFEDADGDGVGTRFGATVVGCSPPEGYAAAWGDCDDDDDMVHPGAVELCNGIDDDCDGVIDDAQGTAVRYPDADADGAGDASQPIAGACGADQTLVDNPDDCDDGDAARGPQATELCNGIDDDCDGLVDEEACPCLVDTFDGQTYQLCTGDAEWLEAQDACRADGYDLATISSIEENLWINRQQQSLNLGNLWFGANDRVIRGDFQWSDGSPWGFEHWSGGQPSGGGEDCVEMFTVGWWNDLDCGDDRPFVCEIDCVPVELFIDADGDGFGDPGSGAGQCPGTPGWSVDAGDCDDADPTIHPGRPDPPGDGVDQDCSGADRCWLDRDGDGFGGDELISCDAASSADRPGDCDDGDASTYPGAPEVPGDGVDSDCDAVDLCYDDADGDGIGGEVVADDDLDCLNDGLSPTGGDCDDSDPEVLGGCDATDGSGPRPPLVEAPHGCGCRAQGSALSGWLSLGLGLLALRRRARATGR